MYPPPVSKEFVVHQSSACEHCGPLTTEPMADLLKRFLASSTHACGGRIQYENPTQVTGEELVALLVGNGYAKAPR